MGRKNRAKAAYVVFVGRIRGIFTTWIECEAQVHGYPGNKQRSFDSTAEARTAWEEFVRSTQQVSSLESREIPDRLPAGDLLLDNVRLFNPEEDQNYARKRTFERIMSSTSSGEGTRSAVKKRKNDISNESLSKIPSGNQSPKPKIESGDPIQLQDEDEFVDVEGQAPVELAIEQQAVVNLALTGANIFLTGAAGSGKTVTLREMIKHLKHRYSSKRSERYPTVQVVAPTGIAALPLDGKTTYSFAGWNPDSLQQPMEKLLNNVRKSTTEAVEALRVLIIEEVSMVENQFLERLNRLLQGILSSNAPFGGIQVILVGDFHQLPPVKPFQNCMECGEMMIRKNGYVCQTLKTTRCNQVPFKEGDKWAFKAPIWEKLKLRPVKLEQIHRQRATRFQDVLNKIRNGVALEDNEWDELERPKELPRGAVAVRLMSLVDHVNLFNNRELEKLNTKERRWEALDASNKKFMGDADRLPPRCHIIATRNKEFRNALAKYHRFPTCLELKIGAKVVLLFNLSPKSGLVNGSQGEVVGFVNTESWPSKDEGGLYQKGCADEFTAMNSHWRPIVKFANGKTQTIPHIVQSSTKMSGEDHYYVVRTQIPLMLAWALSIHKSQGMTLQYAEVSSRSLFETGQLYVGVSRVTRLEGLVVTGFAREKTTMDPDVLEFYEKTPWEVLGPSSTSESIQLKTETTMPEEWLEQDYTPLQSGEAHSVQVAYPQLQPKILEICDSDEWDSENEQG
jgi:ATP-dependent DNA helicase PIF1